MYKIINHINYLSKGCDTKMRERTYKYKINEVVNNLKIVEQIKVPQKSGGVTKQLIKGYRYECLKCGNRDILNEYDLKKGVGCNFCKGHKVIKGVNDIVTTHPQLVEYFVNKEDAYIYSYGSNKKITLRCPDCGEEKMMTINKLSRYGFSCPRCGDGISYPEKFMISVLDQLGIEYKKEYSPDWIKPRRYDFYIRKYNLILEIDGEQHYKESGKQSCFTSLNKQQIIDFEKEKQAKLHNIKLIRIDCSISNKEYIKKSIIKSKINNIFDVRKINFDKCNEFASNSKVKYVCDLWNKDYRDIQELVKKTKFHRDTIAKYLKIGADIGICDYKAGMFKNKGVLKAAQNRKRPIRCVNTGEIFESASYCAKHSEEIFGIKLSRQGIVNVLLHKSRTHKKYIFEYIYNKNLLSA